MIMMQQDMEAGKIPALVKVGRQIISMTLLEIAGNGHKKRAAAELSEEAAMTTMALAPIQHLFVAATVLPTPTPTATLVLALLYI